MDRSLIVNLSSRRLLASHGFSWCSGVSMLVVLRLFIWDDQWPLKLDVKLIYSQLIKWNGGYKRTYPTSLCLPVGFSFVYLWDFFLLNKVVQSVHIYRNLLTYLYRLNVQTIHVIASACNWTSIYLRAVTSHWSLTFANATRHRRYDLHGCYYSLSCALVFVFLWTMKYDSCDTVLSITEDVRVWRMNGRSVCVQPLLQSSC